MSTPTPDPPKLPPEYIVRGPYEKLDESYCWYAIAKSGPRKYPLTLARIRTTKPPEVQLANGVLVTHTFPTWDEALRYVETICALGEL
jgi:hypothetical protein